MLSQLRWFLLLGLASCRTETRGESEKNGRFEGEKKQMGRELLR